MRISGFKRIFVVITAFVMFISMSFSANLKNAYADEGRMIKVYFSCDYQEVQGQNGHSYAPTVESIRKQGINWGAFDITVTDSAGKVYKVPRKDSGAQEIYLGQFPLGETLNVKVNPDSLPQGYHLSAEYNPISKKWEFMSKNYKIGGVDGTDLGYNDTYTIRIALGKTDAVFDLNGGNVNGKTDRITEKINRDDTVAYPTPVKSGLTFMNYWYTIDDKNVKHWIKQGSPLSDYSHDWVSWNKESFDPKYDGKFVMRAGYWAKVTFDTDGGSKEKDQWVIEGNTVMKPTTPVKEGYKFVEWVTADKTPYDFNQTVTKGMTLYAKWIKNPTVDKIVENDNVVKVKVPAADDNTDKIVIKLPGGSTVTVTKDSEGNWKTETGDVVKIVDNHLQIPVDSTKIKKGETVVVTAYNGNVPSEDVTTTIEGKKDSGGSNSDKPSDKPSNKPSDKPSSKPSDKPSGNQGNNNKTTSSATNSSSPNTGDESQLYLLMIALLSSVGMTVSLVKRRNK